jgi:hypothetical protein
MKPIFEYIERQREPYQSMLLFIREIILSKDEPIEESVKYQVPFYKYKGKMLMYLNVKENYLDVAFMQGILLQPQFSILENHKTRKQVRSFKVKSLEDFDVSLFENMLLEACKMLESSKSAWLGK